MTETLDAASLNSPALARFSVRPNVVAMARERRVPVLDVVVPVYNEQTALAASVRRLHRYLAVSLPYSARITIADNASTDDTASIAAKLADELADVRVVRLEQKGRGRALSEVWSASDAQVLAYMDVDLSTDLAALQPLVAPISVVQSPLAIDDNIDGQYIVMASEVNIPAMSGEMPLLLPDTVMTVLAKLLPGASNSEHTDWPNATVSAELVYPTPALRNEVKNYSSLVLATPGSAKATAVTTDTPPAVAIRRTATQDFDRVIVTVTNFLVTTGQPFWLINRAVIQKL